jgi:hypothetical protein
MTLDYNKLKEKMSVKKQIDPRKIFTTLNRDTSKFRRPSDEQGDVLSAWYEKRKRVDNTIKMNTGSGKTIVGLLCLQSCLNEGVGPAVYITPDNYLLSQVVSEAKSLGILTVEDPYDPAFISSDAILVINVWKLINGRSIFGVARDGVKIDIGSIVVDDAHACLATVADQFRIRLPSTHEAYKELFAIFKSDLENQSESGVLDIEAEDPMVSMLIPYWAWKNRHRDVLKILHKHRESDALKWPWRLVEDVIDLCQAAIGGGMIEIAPRFLPIDNIPSFFMAKRRIYMTATLADDGVLVSHFQANPDEIADPIRPKGGGDIGDRMILAPQEINPSISIDEVKELSKRLSEGINVLVIVPSNSRAKYWLDVAAQTLTADNMSDGVEKLRCGHVGLTVLVAKYDGVDLPAKACELLIIDGLPEVSGLIERIEQSVLDGTRRQLIRQIQRVEQGMGRGVRSSEDHCVVLLMGARLTQRLRHPEAWQLFSVATRAQMELGRSVTEQIKGKPLTEIEKTMNLCLDGEPGWVETSRGVVVGAEEGDPSHIDETVVLLRKAFDSARSKRYDRSESFVQEALNNVSDKRLKGYLKQQLAEYVYYTDQVKAQEIQLSAVELNRSLVRPILGVTYSKLKPSKGSQSVSAVSFMKQFLEKNDMLIWVNSLIEELAWGEQNSKKFENAIYDLGRFLGFGSQQPEKVTGRGPDNLWAIGGTEYLVIECKSGAVKATAINKHDCNQLAGSMNWFKKQYENSGSATPIIVHPRNNPEFAATLDQAVRVINVDKLSLLSSELRKYSIAVGDGYTLDDAKIVENQLNHFHFTKDRFVSKFTVKAT